MQSKKLNVQSKLQNCAVQNMCFELSHQSTTRVILSSAASAAVAGGSWQLVCPIQAGRVYTVSANSVAGLQRLTQFLGIQAQRKPVTHYSISSTFSSEANTGLRLPRSAKASAAPVVDC